MLLLTPAATALDPEFNWVPSGRIDVGDRTSEAAGGYEACGEIRTVELAYRDGAVQRVTGRLINGPETFTIRSASWRGGPGFAHIVIWRRVDTDELPRTASVQVDGKHVGDWTIRPPVGPRRLHDSPFVIPPSAFPDGKPPAEVRVTVTSERPALSLGYRFAATRDWDVLKSATGDLRAATTKTPPADGAYVEGILAEGDHDWAAALGRFEDAQRLGAENVELVRLTRQALRRVRLRAARAVAAADTAFDTHYRLGLLAGAWGCWEDAAEEYRLAVLADPIHADATYRWAEALEYCRRPIEEWADLMERAGSLGASEAERRGGGAKNVQRVLIAVHVDPLEGVCGQFSAASLAALRRDWRYVEQQVYGASRGAYRLKSDLQLFRSVATGESARWPWVWQAGWIFQPPDEAVPVTGTYDYSIGTAEFNSSHAGGVDCGVAGSGGAQIGAQRGWEVFLHEWNHPFDWVCVYGEQVPGFPVTHDSDGCGKQPIVSMGCGHRSALRYYVNRAQYRRHAASDPVNEDAFVRVWTLGPLLAAPQPANDGAESQAQQHQPKLLEELKAPNEDAIVRGEHLQTFAPLPVFEAEASFVDLRRAYAPAPEKCVAYVRTFVHSAVDQEVRLWLGYNDCAALWLNGRLIHRGAYYACAKWEDQNRPYMLAKSAMLRRGWNCIAAKVERGGGEWGFSVHLVDFENRAIKGLEIRPQLRSGEHANTYAAPAVGPYYRWADVQDDYVERLPRLDEAALARIAGMEGLQLAEDAFLLTLPEGMEAQAGSRYVAERDDADATLNNYLNWDREVAAALRYVKDGEAHDLLMIRPEYYDEFFGLLREAERGWARGTRPAERVLGYILIPKPRYESTPNRSPRLVLVLDAALGDYPAEDLDLLGP